jgi:hypothetical protein
MSLDTCSLRQRGDRSRDLIRRQVVPNLTALLLEEGHELFVTPLEAGYRALSAGAAAQRGTIAVQVTGEATGKLHDQQGEPQDIDVTVGK